MTGNIVPQFGGAETMTELEFHPNGILWSRAKNTVSGRSVRTIRKGGKRGKIKGFSVASARRLREILLTHFVPDADCYNVTLTLPGKLQFSKVKLLKGQPGVGSDGLLHRAYWEQDYVRANWFRGLKVFFETFKRWFPGSVFVWRIEMHNDARSGAPHLHACLWVPRSETVPEIPGKDGKGRKDSSGHDDMRTNGLCAVLCEKWMAAMGSAVYRHGQLLTRETRNYWKERAIRVSRLHCDDSGSWNAAFAYMCSHSGKHKEAQLGWSGRQWGIINKPLFVRRTADKIPLLHFHEVYLRRLLRKLSYHVIECPCVFGTKKAPIKRRATQVQFLTGNVAAAFERGKNWLLEHYPPRSVRDSRLLSALDIAMM